MHLHNKNSFVNECGFENSSFSTFFSSIKRKKEKTLLTCLKWFYGAIFYKCLIYHTVDTDIFFKTIISFFLPNYKWYTCKLFLLRLNCVITLNEWMAPFTGTFMPTAVFDGCEWLGESREDYGAITIPQVLMRKNRTVARLLWNGEDLRH